MTSYFDSAHERARKLVESAPQLSEGNYSYEVIRALEEMEAKVILDCKLVAALPIMPETHRDAILLVIARYAEQPIEYIDRSHNDNSDSDRLRRYNDLVWHLHTVFHEVGRLGKIGDWWWSDNPSSNIRGWAERHDDRMIALMRENPDTADFREAIAKYDAGVARTTAELEKD
jgi:hypothetical protein